MQRYDVGSPITKSFADLSRLFYGSFAFSLMSNLMTTVLTLAYVRLGWGSELNPLMALELKTLGVWVVPFHVVSILAYYVLFYFTMRHTTMTAGRFKLWYTVLVLIPLLSSFDLAFDLRSVI